MNWNRMLLWSFLTAGYLLICSICYASAMDPKFDPSTRMRLVLVPADAAVGSVIYRLRATDDEFDYPLQFELIGDSSSSTVQIETLPCTKYNSVCQANVILTRRLEPGRYYDFQVSVKDTRGGMATQSCSLTATNFTTPHEMIFPHKPGIIMIPEDAKRGTELDYVIARKNPLFPKPVYLELWGSPLFAIRQKIVSPEMTEGTIFLLGPLDFEKQSMYHLTVLANDAYAEPGQDTRNIAGLEVVVVVEDVQDVPPIFTVAPPVTRLPSGLIPGDKILQVQAEDGDKGVPREIRYGLVSEGNPFTSFFDINDTTGEIFLVRPLDEIAAITHIGDPVLLTVIAEEVKVMRDEPPAMATTVQLAFLLPERENSPPYFENDHYIARIDENSPQGTALTFNDPYVTRVYDDDTGKNGVFSLTLLNNNGTFEISPNVAERRANFLIRVRDNTMLDYEVNQTLQFQILAQELGPATNLSAIVNVTVYINDVNDNPPVFSEASYSVELPENMTTGTRVVQVHADDIDTGAGGRVRYTQILGYLNTSLNLNAESGLITVSTDNHGFDREMMPEYHFYVEARDEDGTGNRAQVPLIIKLIDVNDETPIFEKSFYEFILASDFRNFTSPAFIKATDIDAEPPNNVVRYELINGNYDNKFKLNEVTGELTLRSPLMKQSDTDNMGEYSLTARAFDLGVPVRWSTTNIKIYPPESRTRTIMFVVPGSNPDKRRTEETLSAITGGKVTIEDIRPYTGKESGEGVMNIGGNSREKSVVVATVLYDNNSVVDVSKIQERLSNNNITAGIYSYEDADLNIHKSENRLLFWLLIILALLIALIILTLLFCCICSWCPLYGFTRKRVIRVGSTEDDVHLVHRDKGIAKQSKSVQVAEWMGRREAWSADRSADSRTKSTRWEFSRRNNNHEKLRHDQQIQIEETQASQSDIRAKSVEDNRSVRIKNTINEIRSAKQSRLHNSRTNLINDREVYVEDVVEDQDYDNVARVKRHKQLQEQQVDDDSMRRHEMDRGSDIEYDRRGSLKRQVAQEENEPRDQLFIKEGNAEILRLITRGKTDTENIYVNVPQQQQQQQKVLTLNAPIPQYIMVDNGAGKEILMRRYIEEQANGKQIIREHYQVVPGPSYVQSIPNEVQQTNAGEMYVQKSQPGSQIGAVQFAEHQGAHMMDQNEQLLHASHHSLIQQELENSLKQQNALLRQILLEKEKLEERFNQQEVALETQSLPGHTMAMATQTDCDAGTQTEPLHSMRPERRKARSENDDSLSEDDYEYVRYSPPDSPEGVYWIKRRRHRKKSKHKEYEGRRRRVIMVEAVKRKIRTPIQEECEEVKSPKHFEKKESSKKSAREEKYVRSAKCSPLNKETLQEISESLDERIVPKIRGKQKHLSKTYLKPQSEESEKESSDNEVVLKHYEADSLDERSDVEEMEIKCSRRKDVRNLVFSRQGSSTEARDEILAASPDREMISKLHSTKELKSRPASRLDVSETELPSTRLSRRDVTKMVGKGRRQTESEPPVRSQKGPAPKPPEAGGKSKKEPSVRSKTQSETDMLKKLHDEGMEGTKPIPKYMEWYFNKKDVDGKGEKPKTKTVTKKLAPGVEKAIAKKKTSPVSARSEKTDDGKYKPEPLPRKSPPKEARLLKEDIRMAKNFKQPATDEGTHSLLQHCEHRYEHEYIPGPPKPPPTKLPHYLYPETPPQISRDTKAQMKQLKAKSSPIKEGEVKQSRSQTVIEESRQLNAATLEDDHDSGIAMNSLLHSMGRRNPIVDRKSVFTIAYDEVKVKQIRSESESSPMT